MGRTTRVAAAAASAAVGIALSLPGGVAAAGSGSHRADMTATMPIAGATASDAIGGVVFRGRTYDAVLTFAVAGGERRARASVTASGASVARCRSADIKGGAVVHLHCRLVVADSHAGTVVVILTVTTASGSVAQRYRHIVG